MKAAKKHIRFNHFDETTINDEKKLHSKSSVAIRKKKPNEKKIDQTFIQLILFMPSNKFESSYRHQICMRMCVCVYDIFMPIFVYLRMFKGKLVSIAAKLNAGGDCFVFEQSEIRRDMLIFYTSFAMTHSLFAFIVVTCKKYFLAIFFFLLFLSMHSIDSHLLSFFSSYLMNSMNCGIFLEFSAFKNKKNTVRKHIEQQAPAPTAKKEREK